MYNRSGYFWDGIKKSHIGGKRLFLSLLNIFHTAGNLCPSHSSRRFCALPRRNHKLAIGLRPQLRVLVIIGTAFFVALLPATIIQQCHDQGHDSSRNGAERKSRALSPSNQSPHSTKEAILTWSGFKTMLGRRAAADSNWGQMLRILSLHLLHHHLKSILCCRCRPLRRRLYGAIFVKPKATSR